MYNCVAYFEAMTEPLCIPFISNHYKYCDLLFHIMETKINIYCYLHHLNKVSGVSLLPCQFSLGWLFSITLMNMLCVPF